MGRTVPTFRQLIDISAARWSKFRRALRREDQGYFDRLFRRVRSYTQAGTYQANDNPMETILLTLALDHEKRLEAMERKHPPGDNHEAERLDSRPLSLSAGDDNLATDTEPDDPSAD